MVVTSARTDNYQTEPGMIVVVLTYQFAGVSRATLTLSGDMTTRGCVVTFTFLTATQSECPSRTGISAHSALEIITIKKQQRSQYWAHRGGPGSISSNVLYRENISKHK